jgi:hypothetical protein
VTRKCKYCGNEIEGVVPAPSTCWTCYKEIGTEAVSVSEQLENVEEIGILNDESVSKVTPNILFTGSGVYLRKVPISKISSILVDLRKKMDPDFSLNINTEGEFAERMPYFAQYFIRQVEKKKIKIKHLVREGRNISPSKTTEVRYVKKKVASEAAFNIYKDKIAILIWTDPPEGVIIQNKAAADSLKEYFEILWKKAYKRKTMN